MEQEDKKWKRTEKEAPKEESYYIRLPLDKKVNVNLGLRKQKARISKRKILVSIAVKTKKKELGRRLTPLELENVSIEVEKYITSDKK